MRVGEFRWQTAVALCYCSIVSHVPQTRSCLGCRYAKPMLRTVQTIRYVLALREGGSLPAIVEADDLGLYVVKFRGAGQGPLALVAELVAGEIGRALRLKVPELVFAEVDAALGRNEPDAEIRHLLKASTGLNLGGNSGTFTMFT
jgi:hypothetical protein